jgi:hypothetical protein
MVAPRPNEFGPTKTAYRQTQSRFPDTSAAGALRNKSQVTQAAQEHRGDARKQQRADLEAGKVVHTAKTPEDGNGA